MSWWHKIFDAWQYRERTYIHTAWQIITYQMAAYSLNPYTYRSSFIKFVLAYLPLLLPSISFNSLMLINLLLPSIHPLFPHSSIFLSLFIHPPTCPFIHLSIHSSNNLSIHPTTHPFYLTMCHSIHPLIHPPSTHSIHHLLHPSIHSPTL